MNASSGPAYRTEMQAFVLDLLDFIDEKVTEAETDVASRPGAVSEAAGTFPIIRERLYRENQTILTQFMLIGFFDLDLDRIGQAQESEFAVGVDQLRKCVAGARLVLELKGTRSSRVQRRVKNAS